MNTCLHCGKPVKNKFCNVSCQNKHQNKKRIEKKMKISYGEIKEFQVSCEYCKKEFIVKERETKYPQKEKYYCSRSCANTRHPNEKTKNKIKYSLRIIKEPFAKICENCKNIFYTRSIKQRFCCKSCSSSFYNKINKNILVKAGLKSAQIQKEKRRSKNEIYFAELCMQYFTNVLLNEPLFNGWDADVILHNEKIAILWNGKWHYEKLNKKHSVEQVQNRDKIKINEIQKLGYFPYVIKDMGKHNKEFVEKEFEKLKKYIAL